MVMHFLKDHFAQSTTTNVIENMNACLPNVTISKRRVSLSSEEEDHNPSKRVTPVKPPPSLLGASSNGLEDKNKPAPPPPADVSKKVRESPLGSTGVKGASGPSSTPVDKGPTPKDGHPLGAAASHVGDQSKGGGKDSAKVEFKQPPKGAHPSVDGRPKGGDKNPQKTSSNGGGKNNKNKYDYVQSKITFKK